MWINYDLYKVVISVPLIISCHMWKTVVCGFTGTTDGPRKCVLENEDTSKKHFMQIEAESFKYCAPQQQKTGEEELHVINIPDDSIIR